MCAEVRDLTSPLPRLSSRILAARTLLPPSLGRPQEIALSAHPRGKLAVNKPQSINKDSSLDTAFQQPPLTLHYEQMITRYPKKASDIKDGDPNKLVEKALRKKIGEDFASEKKRMEDTILERSKQTIKMNSCKFKA